jgi:dTDP-4-dehydrorhamnose 3,5-epimerase
VASLAARGIEPSVVNDQIGRLSFAQDIAAGIRHLLETGAAYGTYNFSNTGESQSWADVAADVYELSGGSRASIRGVRTAEYFAGKSASPRPVNSVLNLGKLAEWGFRPAGAAARLKEYLNRL